MQLSRLARGGLCVHEFKANDVLCMSLSDLVIVCTGFFMCSCCPGLSLDLVCRRSACKPCRKELVTSRSLRRLLVASGFCVYQQC